MWILTQMVHPIALVHDYAGMLLLATRVSGWRVFDLHGNAKTLIASDGC